MTQYPEAYLARELGLCYATIALVTDYDTGVEDDPSVGPVSHAEVFEVMAPNVATAARGAVPGDRARCRPSGPRAAARRPPTASNRSCNLDRPRFPRRLSAAEVRPWSRSVPGPAAVGAPGPAPAPPPGRPVVGGHRSRSPSRPDWSPTGSSQRAAEAEARWGATRTVLVATARYRARRPPGRARPAARRLPGARGAGRRRPPVPAAGAVAIDAIGAGEVVTAARVGGPAAAGLAGRLPPGTRAVVVPLEVPGLPVRVGDRVDLLAVTSPAAPVAAGRRPVRRASAPDALSSRCDRTEAVAVAAALGQGPIVPALVSAADG